MGTALITGASSGLGEEFAWQLAAAQHDLVLVARRADRLERLAELLHQVAGIHVEVLPADLGTEEGCAVVAERLRVGTLAPGSPVPAARPAGLAPIGLLVNNAGFGQGRGFLENPMEEEQQALDVMVRAVMVLSRAAADQMVSRGRGAIVNVSSVAAYLAAGTYSAHKLWVTTFTESLAADLRGTGVSATAVHPGLTRTEFHDVAGYEETSFPGFAWLNARTVVAQGLTAARRRQVLVTPSLRYKVVAGVVRVAPRSLVRRLRGISSRAI